MLTGACAGFAAGLLGIGGGLIIVPVLYFIFASQDVASTHLMQMALATSLATIIFTSVSSTLAHHRKRAVLWRIVVILAPGIAAGSWLGGVVASNIDSDILKPIFGFFELAVAIHMLSNTSASQHRYSINKISAAIGSAVIGFVSAIVGIGGGTLTVPFLHWHNISIKNAVATSAACGLPIALFGTASFIFAGMDTSQPSGSMGFVNLTAFAFIVVTSFLAAPLGARAAHALPERALKLGFGIFLLLLSARMILV